MKQVLCLKGACLPEETQTGPFPPAFIRLILLEISNSQATDVYCVSTVCHVLGMKGKEADSGMLVYCCCQVASVVSDSVRPHRRGPTRLPRPWDSPGKNTGVGCHFLLQCVKVKVKRESEVAQSCLTLRDPTDCSPPGSSAHGISRQECWSGRHCLLWMQEFNSWWGN